MGAHFFVDKAYLNDGKSTKNTKDNKFLIRRA